MLLPMERSNRWRDNGTSLRVGVLILEREINQDLFSAASGGVYLCHSEHQIMGKAIGLGPVNQHVLIMKHLDGDEYVVDCVSKDGVHKCVAV